MNGKKSPFRSLTILGGLISILPMLQEVLEQALLALPQTPKTASLISAIGGITAILGRLRANKVIG